MNSCKHEFPKRTEWATPRKCILCGIEENTFVQIKNLKCTKEWAEFMRAADIKKMHYAGMFMYVWKVFLRTHPAFEIKED